MSKNRKKGFTLVELLVVIAILAILAVVTVIGYTSFTKKAQESNDISLTTQMNNILDADTAGGKSYETPNDAVSALEEGGLIVTKLTPTTNKYIYVYNINGKQGERMLLLDESYNVKFPAGATLSSTRSDYFTFVSSASEAKKYSDDGFSVYLKDSYSDTSVSISTGLDVGDVTKVTEINYANLSSTESSVIIRTSTGTLNINAPYGTVKHYGTCENVVITAVASKSYHENGSVTVNMEVQAGHVVIEPKSSVKEVSVPASSEGTQSTVSVELKENSTVQTLTVDSTSATVEVKENAKVENVVASTDVKSKITIPASVKVNAIEKTHVKTYEELVKALYTDKVEYVVFDENIEGVGMHDNNYGICIEGNTVIDGNNHTFTTTASRAISIDYYHEDIEVTIKNLNIVVNCSRDTDNGTRGIQVVGEDAKVPVSGTVNLCIDNVKILTNDNSNYKYVKYAINICNDATVNLTVTNSHVIGYAAINLWSALYSVKVSNSTLECINDNSNNQSNEFGAVCLEGNLEGHHASLIDIDIVNSKIVVKSTQGCNQAAIKYNINSKANIVKLTNTVINYDGEGTCLTINNGTKNELYIDGEEYNFD